MVREAHVSGPWLFKPTDYPIEIIFYGTNDAGPSVEVLRMIIEKPDGLMAFRVPPLFEMIGYFITHVETLVTDASG